MLADPFDHHGGEVVGLVLGLTVICALESKEHARQATCIYNQSDIARAVLAFDSRKGRLPGYHERFISPGGGNGVHYAWPVALLPELGRTDLCERFIDDGAATAQASELYVDIFVCPSAEKPKDRDSLCYVVNTGRLDADYGDQSRQKHREAVPDGVFHDRSIVDPIQMSTISLFRSGADLSNTLMISENLQAGNWASDEVDETKVGMVWWPDDPPPPGARINEEKETKTPTKYHARPSSNHPGGVVVTFCNGRSEFISEAIDYEVYRSMMTPFNDDERNELPNALPGSRLEVEDY